ncbi:hypothetical protein [Isoptericola sp. BMS4]|uniref:hypothetical protein n=1 Tax=Isoptericola sp. BMS4 TaxID=2527875 RepID=UPI0014214F97|nr:hypothetical protein [Isoptericola sp. BMS4]
MHAADPPAEASDGARPAMPTGLRVVTAGAGIEGLVLVVMAVVVALELVRGESGSVGVSIFLVLFFLGMAAVLVAATRSLWGGRRGGRAPLVVWQVLQGLVGVSLLAGGVAWAVVAGLGLLAVSATVLVALMTRRVVEATAG